jgi:hypothetical protein
MLGLLTALRGVEFSLIEMRSQVYMTMESTGRASNLGSAVNGAGFQGGMYVLGFFGGRGCHTFVESSKLYLYESRIESV